MADADPKLEAARNGIPAGRRPEVANPFQVLSRPLAEGASFYRQDPVLQDLLARLLPADALAWIAPQLERMGELAAGPVDAWAREADRHSPEHRPFDRFGNRVAAKHLVFHAASLLDRADAGGALDARRLRALTPLAKLSTAKLAVWAASEGIELHGGNGYIEDFVMPRLLRDAQVLPVWEGTTNILVLDVLRACRREGCHRVLADDVRAQAEATPASLREEAGALTALAQGLPARFDELKGHPPERQARRARRFADDLTLACAGGLLLEGARAGGPSAGILAAAARRLVQRHLSPTAELSDGEVAALVDSTVL